MPSTSPVGPAPQRCAQQRSRERRLPDRSRATAFISTPNSQGDAVVVGLSRLGRADGAQGEGQLCTLHFITVGPGDARFAFARASVRDGSNRTLKAAFLPARLIVD